MIKTRRKDAIALCFKRYGYVTCLITPQLISDIEDELKEKEEKLIEIASKTKAPLTYFKRIIAFVVYALAALFSIHYFIPYLMTPNSTDVQTPPDTKQDKPRNQ